MLQCEGAPWAFRSLPWQNRCKTFLITNMDHKYWDGVAPCDSMRNVCGARQWKFPALLLRARLCFADAVGLANLQTHRQGFAFGSATFSRVPFEWFLLHMKGTGRTCQKIPSCSHANPRSVHVAPTSARRKNVCRVFMRKAEIHSSPCHLVVCPQKPDLRETEGGNIPQAENGVFLTFSDVWLYCPRSTTVPSCLQTVLIHALFLDDVESKPSICKVKRVLCSCDNTSRIKEKRRGLRPQRLHGEVVEPSKRSRRNSQMKLPLSLRSESPQTHKRSA